MLADAVMMPRALKPHQPLILLHAGEALSVLLESSIPGSRLLATTLRLAQCIALSLQVLLQCCVTIIVIYNNESIIILAKIS